MKRLLSLAMIVFACSLTGLSYGQSMKGDPEARAKKITEKMKTELSLDDQQYTRVYDINLKFAQEAQNIRDSSDDRSGKMSEIRSMNKEKNAQLKTVLSEEQMKMYNDKQKEMRSHAKERHRNKSTIK